MMMQMPPLKDEFWQFNIGHLFTMVSVALTVYASHLSNVRRIETAAREWAEMRTKLDLIFAWFQNNVVMQAKEHGKE
jgi:hypothetical protein